VPIWPPAPPVDFVPRPAMMAELKADLLNPESREAVANIDDVWHRSDPEPSLKGELATTRLVTTRFASELPGETVEFRLGAMIGGADGEAVPMAKRG
jgi:hypothetical protein